MGLFCIILVLRTLPTLVCQDIYVNCTQNFDLTPSSSFYLKVERKFNTFQKKVLCRANYFEKSTSSVSNQFKKHFFVYSCDFNINYEDLNYLQSKERYKGGIYLRILLPLVSSPEMKASLMLPLGEGRRLYPDPGLWSPCGPQVLPCDVSASRDQVLPLASLLTPSMLVIDSLSLNSKVSSSP